jgi:hypothetical protein
MYRYLLALFAVAVLSLTLVGVAGAAPTQVEVRIEGRSETLFEGPVLTDGHDIKALSDSESRRCNGLDNGADVLAGPTPTAASVDAMRIIGEPFDGNWYSQYDDYFITRWGPDRQDELASEYWGVVVNNVFTDVGGCQYELDGGDEVLWIYDAFDGRERLALYPAGDSAGPVPLTATATLDQPFEVEVDSWPGYSEGEPPASPGRSTTPYADAEVAPVTTGSDGFQKVEVADPDTVTTAADGKAAITFTMPGWHRIKATDLVAGVETAIRSNRLDVCVPEPPASGCGPPPSDDQVRAPPPLPEEENRPAEEPGPETKSPGGGISPSAGGPTHPAAADPLRVAIKGLDRGRLDAGLLGVRWQVIDPGPGLRGWEIAAKILGKRGSRFLTRAGGRSGSSAQIRLRRGAAYRLKITFTDLLGRQSSTGLGTVRIPKR